MCYIIPTIAALTTTFAWGRKKTMGLFWLTLMFFGGSLFGIIDHLWNRELFLVSKDWLKDLALGGVITIGIISAWVIILAMAKKTPALVIYPKTSEIK